MFLQMNCAIIRTPNADRAFAHIHRILGGSIMGNKKYVAYVGTYTYGTSKGIQVYDVDVELSLIHI